MINDILKNLLDSDLVKSLEEVQKKQFSKLNPKDRVLVNSKTNELKGLIVNQDQEGLAKFLTDLSKINPDINAH